MPETPQFAGCEVVRKLESGPVCDVYYGIQEPLGRPVFIKALGSSILPSSPFAAPLEREARLLSVLNHPGIVKVYDFVRQGERMWLVLEYVDGFSLEELKKQLPKLPQAAACAIASEVARALAHAHAHGIVHRDITPKNVLISKRGEVKLVGFTVAVDERMASMPELLEGDAQYSGPSYMSPEQILGEPADPRADIFSLGVVLYELLAGERPFDGPDDRSTSQRIRNDPTPPLARKAHGVLPAVERLVQRCLEKMPGDRFQSANELADALDSAREEFDGETTQSVILLALSSAKVFEGNAPRETAVAKTVTRAVRGTLSRLVWGLSAAFALIVVGGVAIQYGAERNEGNSASRGQRLELAPADKARLRVVAHPWARVLVDGQYIDTTPFARAIPLSAGTHYVRLEHPNAPEVRRVIQLAPGETLLLEVNLKVEAPPFDPGDAGSPHATDATIAEESETP